MQGFEVNQRYRLVAQWMLTGRYLKYCFKKKKNNNNMNNMLRVIKLWRSFDHMAEERFLLKKIPQGSWRRKKHPGIDILLTSRTGNKKVYDLSTWQEDNLQDEENQPILPGLIYTQIDNISKTSLYWPNFTVEKRRSSIRWTSRLACLFLVLVLHIVAMRSNSTCMKILRARSHRFKKIKEFCRRCFQIFLTDSCSNIHMQNVKLPIQLVVHCAIWYHLYNLKNEKLKLLHGCFSRFLNCTNGTKSRKAPHLEVQENPTTSIVFLWQQTNPYHD